MSSSDARDRCCSDGIAQLGRDCGTPRGPDLPVEFELPRCRCRSGVESVHRGGRLACWLDPCPAAPAANRRSGLISDLGSRFDHTLSLALFVADAITVDIVGLTAH